MEKEFDKIHNKLDSMTDKIHNIDKTLIRQEENLKEHMRRSVANEKAVELLAKELAPVKKHVQTVGNIFRAAIATGSLLLFLNEMGWLKKLAAFLF